MKKCECKEKSCADNCIKKHTCHTYWCNECQNKKEWKKHGPHKLFDSAECFYQKEVLPDIYVEILQYPAIYTLPVAYEIRIQLQKDESITMNINQFGYRELDFERMEKDALEIINKFI